MCDGSLKRKAGRVMGLGWFTLILLFPNISNARRQQLRTHPRVLREDKSATTTSRIVGGSNANPTRYPYFALLDIVTSSEGTYQCGGSLIAADMIMTAQHCTSGIGFVTRIVAHVNSTGSDSGRYEYDRDVTSSFRHLSYNRWTQQNDIMLLKLSNPVLDVPLVQLNIDRNAPSDNEDLSVFGFGITTYSSSTTTSSHLQVVTVNAISHSDCNDASSYQGQVYDNEMICASAPGKDSCSGDSGGPIVISGGGNNPGQDVVVGITSWGYQCALSNYPGIYTRVSQYEDWIQTRLCAYSDYPPTLCPGIPTPNPTSVPPTPRPTTATIMEEPSGVPSLRTSTSPSAAPSQFSSLTPSTSLSVAPSQFPSVTSSTSPSVAPSQFPSVKPSNIPSNLPTGTPSTQPSLSPTTTYSAIPTVILSMFPSELPSTFPSQVPSDVDIAIPSSLPSDRLSTNPPTNMPSSIPSGLSSNYSAPDPTFVLECFSGDATIHVLRHDTKGRTAARITQMKDLHVGDYVLVDQTRSRYEQVYSFGHWNAHDDGAYIQLHPIGLQVSANHLVFREQSGKSGEAVPASVIQVGDILLGGVVVTKVTHDVMVRGMYAPLTASGRIVVNGIVCSTYISFQENASTLQISTLGNTGLSFHWLSHVFELPHRFWCQYIRQSSTEETYNENGIATSVVSQMEVVLWLFQEQPPHIGLMIPLIFLAFTLDLLERISMAPWSAAMIFLVLWIALFKFVKKHGVLCYRN